MALYTLAIQMIRQLLSRRNSAEIYGPKASYNLGMQDRFNSPARRPLDL